MRVHYPNETTVRKLEEIMEKMKNFGPPVVRAVERFWDWYALEGSHRIVAANKLRLPVFMLPCTENEVVTWSTDICVDGSPCDYFGRPVSEILETLYDDRFGFFNSFEEPPSREIAQIVVVNPTMPKETVTQKLLLQLFGDEKQIGVWDDGEKAFLPEHYGDFGICTNGARFVVEKVGGIIVGFAEGMNPSAHKELRDGHDFALVAGRFVVDLWAAYYPCVNKETVIDLADPKQVLEHLPKYGNPKNWEVLCEGDSFPGSCSVDISQWRKFSPTDLCTNVRSLWSQEKIVTAPMTNKKMDRPTIKEIER